MTGRLTTHALDLASGRPASGLALDLYRIAIGIDGTEERTHLIEAATNADGRVDGPLLEGETFLPGVYEIVFRAGDYLRAAGHALPDPAFLDRIPIRFGIARAEHHHVPLLLSPHGYSTYRGS